MTYFTSISRLNVLKPVFAGLLLVCSVSSFSVNAEQPNVVSVVTEVSEQDQQKSPGDVVKDTVDSIITNIQTNRAQYKDDSQALYAMLDETLVPALHVPRMSKLILGREVAKHSTEQQLADFAHEFKVLLMRTYADALLEYTGEQKVVYDDVQYKKSGDIARVKGTLISADGQEYGITLHMSNRDDDEWRAYNMEAAGINVLSTYRSTFGPIVKKKGLEGLIADLREKNS